MTGLLYNLKKCRYVCFSGKHYCHLLRNYFFRLVTYNLLQIWSNVTTLEVWLRSFCVSLWLLIRCYIYSIILRGKFVFLDLGVQNITEFSNIDSSGICFAPMLHFYQMSHFIDYFSSFFHNFSFFIRKKIRESYWDKWTVLR